MLDTLKRMLGIKADDTSPDDRLNDIINITKQRLKVKLGGLEPPTELEYIIIEVSIIRFNRIGSEGLDSHTVDGESLTFSDNDFNGFANDIQDYLDAQKESKKGKVRFL